MNRKKINQLISKFSLFILFLFLYAGLWGQVSRDEYIKQYSKLAIREMKRTGIPASITMAQALLESDNGNSKLARRANNHFGIKCGGNWEGKTFHQDDDARHECFRKYKTVDESYRDHSEFLKKDRYKALFDLSKNDYKGWARGLKKAGYATNPKYPALLIRIIEDNKLSDLDADKGKGEVAGTDIPKINNARPKPTRTEGNEFVIEGKHHQVKLNNRIKYIIVKSSDTFRNINKEFDLMAWQIPKYNELPADSKLVEGQLLYLQPKRNKAEVGYDFHIFEQNETMYSVSQKYGIKLRKLYELNLLPEGIQPKIGTKLYLRKRKK